MIVQSTAYTGLTRGSVGARKPKRSRYGKTTMTRLQEGMTHTTPTQQGLGTDLKEKGGDEFMYGIESEVHSQQFLASKTDM